MAVEQELATLRHLHAVLHQASHDLGHVVTGLDEAVTLELWAGPLAEELRETWRVRRDCARAVLTDLLLASVEDVRVQHNNLAEATGHRDRL